VSEGAAGFRLLRSAAVHLRAERLLQQHRIENLPDAAAEDRAFSEKCETKNV
jgi:hypothetical protein